MSKVTSIARRTEAAGAPDPNAILTSVPIPVVVLDTDRVIRFVNFEAEQFFGMSEASLTGLPLAELLPADSPIHFLIDQALDEGASMSDYGVTLETPRIGRHVVTITVGPVGDPPQQAVITLQEQSIARRIDNQLSHRNAARSVSAMAAMLAHEVKNPLSGIRGAAQLLEQTVGEDDRPLTRLICDEADRIVGLVNRMDVFSDRRAQREAVNIHTVLERVRKVAQNGFAKHARFAERYDPSLPPVFGNHDQLVQVFMNLVKNASESVPADTGEILITTRYQRGVSIAMPGTDRRVHLPLLVTIQDNGDGIPEDLHEHLFDPFVTTKANGTGLGLALVAKIVDDHGGFIGFESEPRRTVFKISLPIWTGPVAAGGRPEDDGR
ncbi:MAG: PAS domain-containing protein [Alphaproteobacteria bacterium]|jgi:two-component system nitrogen regulation sensor histidine kinase GlnL|nr:PAS domain-containing protein [Alphaproteobacteria bacterium]